MFKTLLSVLALSSIAFAAPVSDTTANTDSSSSTIAQNNDDPQLIFAPYIPPYSILPPTPTLPKSLVTGYIPVSKGGKIWYSIDGLPLKQTLACGGIPVLFLHGGFANSNYFAHQIDYLRGLNYTLISMDSRGHGRSVEGPGPMTYDLMTKDVIAVLDYLKVPKVSVVGWSDGGCIGFDMAMNYTSRMDRLFSYGGSYSPDNINSTIGNSSTFNEYGVRVEQEYKQLNPNASHYDDFADKMNTMWASLPDWDFKSFAKIPTLYNRKQGPLIWIVDGQEEEGINRTTPYQLHDWVC